MKITHADIAAIQLCETVKLPLNETLENSYKRASGNAVRKQKYGNLCKEVRRKVTYQYLVPY